VSIARLVEKEEDVEKEDGVEKEAEE